MKISVIIVNYKVPDYLHQAILSIERATADLETEIFVVDNNSEDGSVDFLRKLHPKVIFIQNHENVGFSKANNTAVKSTKGEYVLFVNPDTIIGENVIEECVRVLDDDPSIGAAGVKMHCANGVFAPESKRGVPTPMTAFFKFSGLCTMFPKNKKLGRYYLGHIDNKQKAEVEILSGAFMFIRRDVLDKVGCFDEEYFMYGEDIDLSYRIMKAGYKNYYIPVNIIHYKGESTQKLSYRYVNNFNKSMIIFFKKHFIAYSWILELPILSAVYLKAAIGYVKVGILKISNHDRALQKMVKGHKFLVVEDEEDKGKAQEILKINGYQPETVSLDQKIRKEGHAAIGCNFRQYDFVVYNANKFKYQDIIRFFVDHSNGSPKTKPEMAIFYPEIQKIITSTRIFQN